MRVFHIVGARPNFMKLSPVHRALKRVPGKAKRGDRPPLWDGMAADRIAQVLASTM